MGAALFAGATHGPGNIWSDTCCKCTTIDASEWLFCPDEEGRQASRPSKAKESRRRQRPRDAKAVDIQRLEDLTRDLFRVHDLNDNGVLEELELIRLNETIAILHHGKDTDLKEVRSKYRGLFRAKLDPNGMPVPYETFRKYVCEVLDGLDTDPEAQEMILEQFVAEAQSGRLAFNLVCSSNENQLMDMLYTSNALGVDTNFRNVDEKLHHVAATAPRKDADSPILDSDGPAGVPWRASAALAVAPRAEALPPHGGSDLEKRGPIVPIAGATLIVEQRSVRRSYSNGERIREQMQAPARSLTSISA